MKEQEFFEKMASVWIELATLQEQAGDLMRQMEQLESAGIVNATIHTRSDNGGMELLHPTGSEYEQRTGRRREYIGKKPEAQDAARAKIQRYHDHVKLKAQWQTVASKRIEIQRQIERLEIMALGKQAKLFSDVGTDGPMAAGPSVPTDYTGLTPQMVIDYFKRSTVLAPIAEDVEAVLGKVEWAEVQKAA